MRRVVMLLPFLLSIPAVALGHGLFWATGDDGRVLMIGHPDGSGHGGLLPMTVSSGLVAHLETCDAEGGWRYRGSPPRGHLAIEAVAASLVEVDYGWWSVGAEGVAAVPPERMPGVIESRHTRETLKEFYEFFPGWNSPFGQGFEITPLVNPFTLSEGDRFTVQVTLDGRPLEDLRVVHDGEPRGRTDLGGQVRLKIRRPGWQEIVVDLYEERPGDLHASELHTTRLSFFVEEAE